MKRRARGKQSRVSDLDRDIEHADWPKAKANRELSEIEELRASVQTVTLQLRVLRKIAEEAEKRGDPMSDKAIDARERLAAFIDLVENTVLRAHRSRPPSVHRDAHIAAMEAAIAAAVSSTQ